jgi:hypothetical protein
MNDNKNPKLIMDLVLVTLSLLVTEACSSAIDLCSQLLSSMCHHATPNAVTLECRVSSSTLGHRKKGGTELGRRRQAGKRMQKSLFTRTDVEETNFADCKLIRLV